MVREVTASHAVQPILEDLLVVPEDRDSLLSTGRDLSGFLVNVAFEPSSKAELAGIEPCLRTLGRVCADLGGRVSLSKNVRVETADLERMYGPQLDAFFELKRRVDPKGVLSSRFFERLFPERMGSRLRARG
jgi:FAD/FMN-containing dehydrogenase